VKEQKKITVRVYNKDIIIDGGDWDELYVYALAEYVDKHMHKIANTTNTVDSSKVAVLAALSIADELFKLRDSKVDSGEVSKELKTMAKKLTDAMR